jgi:hypothetical protein
LWNILEKLHLEINLHLKNERPGGKTGPVCGWVPVGGGSVNRKGEGVKYDQCTL